MLAGRSMLEWSVQPFLIDAACRGLVVALAPDDEHWSQVRSRLQRVPIEAVGGAERADSVRSALQRLQASGVGADEWVLVHDAARCLVTPAQIRQLIAACQHDPVGGLLAQPLADTLKVQAPAERADADPRVSATLERSGKWLAQTPQMFRLQALHDALAAVAASGFAGITDEASAMERLGLKPRLVEGSAQNFKVTYPADFALAEAILGSRA